MIIMKVRCHACGGTWEVYAKLRAFDQSRECPHCGHKIQFSTWHDNILPAYETAKAANLELAHDSAEYHNGLFSVDFIADTKFANAGKE